MLQILFFDTNRRCGGRGWGVYDKGHYTTTQYNTWNPFKEFKAKYLEFPPSNLSTCVLQSIGTSNSIYALSLYKKKSSGFRGLASLNTFSSIQGVIIICSKFNCSKNLLDMILLLLDTVRAIIFFLVNCSNPVNLWELTWFEQFHF